MANNENSDTWNVMEESLKQCGNGERNLISNEKCMEIFWRILLIRDLVEENSIILYKKYFESLLCNISGQTSLEEFKRRMFWLVNHFGGFEWKKGAMCYFVNEVIRLAKYAYSERGTCWFSFYSMGQEESENILQRDRNGTFLVRLSEEVPGAFSIAVKDGMKVHHYRVYSQPLSSNSAQYNAQLHIHTIAICGENEEGCGSQMKFANLIELVNSHRHCLNGKLRYSCQKIRFP